MSLTNKAPSSITELSIDVADKTVKDLIDEFSLLYGIFYAIDNDVIFPAEDGNYYIYFDGKHPYPMFNLSYRPWKKNGSGSDYEGGSILLGSVCATTESETQTRFKIDGRFVDGMRNGMTVGEYCKKQYEKLKKIAKEELEINV